MMNVIPMRERCLTRIPVHWPAHVRVAGRLLPHATARDTSAAGVFLQFSDASRLPPKGSWIEIRLFLPGRGRFLDLAGNVRWVGFSQRHQTFGLGVEFAILAANGAHPWAA